MSAPLPGKLNLLDRSLEIPIDTACEVSKKMVSEVNENNCLVFIDIAEKFGLGITKKLKDAQKMKSLQDENVELKANQPTG